MKKSFAYSGGLAEIISHPSPITYSFFQSWFTGASSLGFAMELLKLPYVRSELSILKLMNNELFVHLKNEEATLYQQTIFSYKPQKFTTDIPQLTLNFSKFFNPLCLLNTGKIVFAQAHWLANPEKTLLTAQNWALKIPTSRNAKNSDEIDSLLKEKIWPSVLAIDFLCEFYNQYIQREYKDSIELIQTFIGQELASRDWFFHSITDQFKVKQKELPFEEYIHRYGLRSDSDYELTSPRWYEIQDLIQKRIFQSEIQSSPLQKEKIQMNISQFKYLSVALEFQVLRNQVKEKTLFFINELRQKLILEKKMVSTHPENFQTKNSSLYLKSNSGKGIPVSFGSVTGKILQVQNNEISIPQNTIGIFPNASPEFTFQFPKCKGLIFLKGGMTSHGAIVAREFGIPALIDPHAGQIPNGTPITLDGGKGSWKGV